MASLEILCPCGKNTLLYRDCCKLIHNNIFKAYTAEDLMRSRYSAFVLCMGDFLLQSHSIQYKDPLSIHNTIHWAKSVAWNRLEIISKSNGLENETFGTVEFKAYFKEKNKLKCIHENSYFIKENLHWVYLNHI